MLVLLSYVMGPEPMSLQFWPGAVVMMLFATVTASVVTNGGRSAWFVGVLVLMVYFVFALTLYRAAAQGVVRRRAGRRRGAFRVDRWIQPYQYGTIVWHEEDAPHR